MKQGNSGSGGGEGSRGNGGGGGGGRFKCVGQPGADLSVTVGDGIPGPPPHPPPHLDTFLPPPPPPPSSPAPLESRCKRRSYGCRNKGAVARDEEEACEGHERGRPSAHAYYRKDPQDLWVISNMAAVPCSVSPPPESPPARPPGPLQTPADKRAALPRRLPPPAAGEAAREEGEGATRLGEGRMPRRGS